MRFIIYFICINLIPVSLWAKKVDWDHTVYDKIDLTIYNETLLEVLYKIENEYQVQFKFNPKEIPYYRFDKRYKQVEIYKIIQDLCSGSAVQSIIYDKKTIVLVQYQFFSRENVLETVREWDLGHFKYPIKQGLEFIEILGPEPSVKKENTSFQLTIKDNVSNEPLIGATISTKDFQFSYATDINGQLIAQLVPGYYEFNVQYIGYQSLQIRLSIYDDLSYEMGLEKDALLIDEIEITGKSERADIEQAKAGVTSLTTKQLESIPQAMGEIDIIKSLEVLPGVTSAGDLSSGFNVRGGRIDESLVLFNDAIIFNPTHVVGFISAFNADIINDAQLYKGYVDAEFGNRSSAVLDISGSYGNTKKTRFRGGLGTSMIKGTIDGPLNKNFTYVVSGRASYSDYLLNMTGVPELRKSDAQFYDLYGAFRWKLSPRHQLRMSIYRSSDVFLYNELFGFNWQNQFATATMFSQWGSKVSSSIHYSAGAYENEQYTINNSNSYLFENGISYHKLTAKLTRNFANDNSIKLGVEAIQYNPLTESLSPNGVGSTTVSSALERNGSQSLSPFVTSKLILSEQFSLESGLRYSNYFGIGPTTEFEYLRTEENGFELQGTRAVEKGERYSHYRILEPRISMNYEITNNFSLKVGLGRIAQNAQIISLGNTSIPTDLWVFPNNNIKPRVVNQITGGIYWFLEKYKINTSLGYFYKTTDSFFVLKDFPTIINNAHIETELLPADQRSRGIEFQAEKKAEKWDMLIAYTFARTEFRTLSDWEKVNNGAWYPGDIDIPHQLNFLYSYQLVPTIKLNTSYVYKSGRPITVPGGVAKIDEILIPFYDERNRGRIPAYSRLDVSFTVDLRKIRKEGMRNSFTLGLYNMLYNKNAFNVFFRTGSIGKINAYKFSVIGSMVPSITWNCVIN